MTKTAFLKGLIMTLVGVVVVAFQTTPIVWSMLVITLIGTALVYVGKNALVFLQSPSAPNTLSWQNIVSGVIVAIGSAFVEGVATLAGTGIIDWVTIGKVALSVTLTYLGATLFAGPTNK